MNLIDIPLAGRALAALLLPFLATATPALAGGGCAPLGTTAPSLSLRPDGAGGLELHLVGGPPGGTAFVHARRPGDPAPARRPDLTGCAAEVAGELVTTVAIDGLGRLVLPLGTALAGLEPELRAFCLSPGASLGDSRLSNSVRVSGSSGDAGQQAGVVLVSEFMKDPSGVSDSAGEWLEVHNPGPWPIDMDGWVLADEDHDSTALVAQAPGGLVVAPGGFLVLGRNADSASNGGVFVDHEYSAFSLTNSSDEIVLWTPDAICADVIRYDDGLLWPEEAGRSICLDDALQDELLNDDGGSWCLSTAPQSSGGNDTGTPGAANGSCP